MKLRKLLAVLITVAMIVSVMPVVASAEGLDYENNAYASQVDFAKDGNMFVGENSNTAGKVLHKNILLGSYEDITEKTNETPVVLKNDTYYDVTNIAGTSEADNDSKLLNGYSATPYNFELSGKFLKRVDAVLAAHYTPNSGGYIIYGDKGEVTSDDFCTEFKSIKNTDNVNSIISSVAMDGVAGSYAKSQTPVYMNVTSFSMNDRVFPAKGISLHVSANYSAKYYCGETDCGEENCTDQFHEGYSANYNGRYCHAGNCSIDGCPYKNVKHHGFVHEQMVALYEVEYSFSELVPFIEARINDYNNLADESKKQTLYNAMKCTVDSAVARGFDKNRIEGYSALETFYNRTELTTATLADKLFIYNGNPATMEVGGTLPSDAVVEYAINDGNYSADTVFPSEMGTYNIKAKITSTEYLPCYLSATLTISENPKGKNYGVALNIDNIKNQEAIFTHVAVDPTNAALISTPYGTGGTLINGSYKWYFRQGDMIKKIFDENEYLLVKQNANKYNATKTGFDPEEVEIAYATKGLLTGLETYQNDAVNLMTKKYTIPLSGKLIKYIAVIGGTNNAASQDISYKLTRADGTEDTAGALTTTGNYPLRVYQESNSKPTRPFLMVVNGMEYNMDTNTVDNKTNSVYMTTSVSHQLERGTVYKSIDLEGRDTTGVGNRCSLFSVIEIQYPFSEVGGVIKTALNEFRSKYTAQLTTENSDLFKAITSTYNAAVERGYNYKLYSDLTDDDINYINTMLTSYVDVASVSYDKVTYNEMTARVTFDKVVDEKNVTVDINGTNPKLTFSADKTYATFDIPEQLVGKKDVKINVTSYPCDTHEYELVLPVNMKKATLYSGNDICSSIKDADSVKYELTTNLTEDLPCFVVSGSYSDYKMYGKNVQKGTLEAGNDKTVVLTVPITKNADAKTFKTIFWDSLDSLIRIADIFKANY